eukprot:TRINITY_DN3258_c0_g2_i2.p1 TRINITY_DN3258_c0_g2~~TRINITY_DN3258_c0_g2_i2.p1  ORF type:complete len:255 (+),score=39.36 TRINITY_DN3258_c0_g2_i2:163-927(+)
MQDQTVNGSQEQGEKRIPRKAKELATNSIKEFYTQAPHDNNNNFKILENLKRKIPDSKNQGGKKRIKSADKKVPLVVEDHGKFLFVVSNKDDVTNGKQSSKSCNSPMQNGDMRSEDNQIVEQTMVLSGSMGTIFEQDVWEQDVGYERGDCLLLKGGQVVIVVDAVQQVTAKQRIHVQIFLSGQDVGMIQLGEVPEVYLTKQTKEICSSEVRRKVSLHFNKLQANSEYVCRQQFSLKSNLEAVFKPVQILSWHKN